MSTTTAAASSRVWVIVTCAPATPSRVAASERPSEESEAGRPSRRPDDRELAKGDPAHPGTERLHGRFLRGEQARDVLGVGGGFRGAAHFTGPEQLLDEARAMAVEGTRHARDLAQIHADSDYERTGRQAVLGRDAEAHAVSRGAAGGASSRGSLLHASISEAAAHRCSSPRPRRKLRK